MAVDIKEKISEIAENIKGDKTLLEKFKKDPVKVIEDLLGVDLPDEKIKLVIDGVKAKIEGIDLSATVEDLKDKIGGLFGGK